MPRRPSLTRVAGLTLLLGACSSSPVAAPPPTVDPETAAVCSALAKALPDVDAVPEDLARRDTEPASPLTAAWGDPPVVLRCGAEQSPDLRATSELIAIDGVDWFAVAGEGGYVFTTTGRAVVVEVSVPADYAPETNALVDLAPALLATVPPAA